MGLVIIESTEYSGLILKEKELEEVNKTIKQKEIENKELEEKYNEKQKELEDLILIITGKDTSFYQKIETYDIKESDLAKYLNKYYCEKGKLQFERKKIDKKEQESEEN